MVSVRIHGKKVYVRLNGKQLPVYKIRIISHEPHVASWASTKGKVIRMDDDIVRNKDWVKSLAIHEICEEALARNKYMNYSPQVRNKKAHEEAQKIERKYHIERFGKKSWKAYSKLVNKVWKKEYRQRRR